jgi:predicted FMN-binding regulatory protein PaiB
LDGSSALKHRNGAGLQANSVPFILDADPDGGPGILRAHVARANPLWREARSDIEALVIFQGPQAYISPGWYASKTEHGKVVPTWNYVMVQARGTLRAIDDADWLRAFVTRLTTRHEAVQTRPWAVTDAPADYIDVTFTAEANTPYTLWLRVKALNNNKYNDSLWVQFSDALASARFRQTYKVARAVTLFGANVDEPGLFRALDVRLGQVAS